MMIHVPYYGIRVMKEEIEKAIEQYPQIKQYLAVIPGDLWETVLPGDISDFAAFSAAVKALRIREKERDYIIELRAKYGLPFRPNANIDETIKRVRLIRWKRNKLAEQRGLEDGSENTSVDPIDPDEELI